MDDDDPERRMAKANIASILLWGDLTASNTWTTDS